MLGGARIPQSYLGAQISDSQSDWGSMSEIQIEKYLVAMRVKFMTGKRLS